MSGSAAAQLLLILSSPLLTRLYTPDQFGQLQLFTSFTTILIVILTLKYEVAVVLPKNKKKALNLISLSFTITLIISILSFFFFFIFSEFIANVLNSPGLEPWLVFIPLTALFLGGYKTLEYWNTRNSNFKKISYAKINQSLVTLITQIFIVFIFNTLNGLIMGQILGRITTFLSLFTAFLKNDIKELMKVTNVKRMISVAREYRVFPFYTTSQSLVNSLSKNATPFILGAIYGSAIVGFYALALKVLKIPADLISEAFRQVYLKKISEKINRKEPIIIHIKKATIILALIALLPSFALLFTSPSLFSFAFGEEWREAGQYTSALVIWVYFAFINTPTIATMQALRIQKAHLLLEMIFFVLRVLLMILASINYSALIGILVYSVVSSIYNLLLIFYGNYLIKKSYNVGVNV